MNLKSLGFALALAAVLGGALIGAPAAEAGDGNFELYGGYYFPEDLDEEFTYGLRGGWNLSDRFGLQASAGRIDLGDDFEDGGLFDVEFDIFLIDLSAQWRPGGGDFILFAGPGWSTIDIDVEFLGERFSASDDIFTVHGGLGYEFDLTDTMYLKLDGRARWYDGDEFDAGDSASYDALDKEASIALGWRFGGA